MRRGVDILVYGTAAVPLGLGLVYLDSVLVVAIVRSPGSHELLHEPYMPLSLAAAVFAVLGGAAVIVSRINYVRQHPLIPPPPDAAPPGPGALILTPLEDMPGALDRVVPAGLRRFARGPFATETDVPGPSADEARSTREPVATSTAGGGGGTGTGGGGSGSGGSGGEGEGIVIALGAIGVTVVMLIGLPFAFVVGEALLGVGGGLLVAGAVMVAGVLGFRRLHRMGEPAPTSLSLRDPDAAGRGGGVNAGWVIAWSIVLTTVSMFALLVSLCGSMRI